MKHNLIGQFLNYSTTTEQVILKALKSLIEEEDSIISDEGLEIIDFCEQNDIDLLEALSDKKQDYIIKKDGNYHLDSKKFYEYYNERSRKTT